MTGMADDILTPAELAVAGALARGAIYRLLGEA